MRPIAGSLRSLDPGSDPVAYAATAVSLGLFLVAMGALIRSGGRSKEQHAPADEQIAEAAVRWGLLLSSGAVLAGFILNRNIFNSDNYRYLVYLLTPWSIGFGLAMDGLARRGWRGKLGAAALAAALALLMTLDLAHYYRRYGWIEPTVRPVRRPLRDPVLAWLGEHPEVTGLIGNYWDVYRLTFLTGGRVEGVPYPNYPNRFPEWSRDMPGGRPGLRDRPAERAAGGSIRSGRDRGRRPGTLAGRQPRDRLVAGRTGAGPWRTRVRRTPSRSGPPNDDPGAWADVAGAGRLDRGRRPLLPRRPDGPGRSSTSTSPRSTSPIATSWPTRSARGGSPAGIRGFIAGCRSIARARRDTASAEVSAVSLDGDLAGVQPRYHPVRLAGRAGDVRLAPPARRPGRGAGRRGGLGPRRVRLGPPDPHEHDQRAGQRPAGLLGDGMGLGSGTTRGRRARRAGPGLSGLRRPSAGRAADRLGLSVVYGVYRAADRAGPRGEDVRPRRRPSGCSRWASRSRPCSGCRRRSCSTAPRGPGA